MVLLNSTQRRSDLSLYVANVVYVPSQIAYAFAIVHQEWLALVLVTFFWSAAFFPLRLFRNFANWPKASKCATYLTPVYVVLGFTLPIDIIRWWAAVPVILYICVGIVGAYALRRANIER